MLSKTGYFLLQCLLVLISPILSFLVALRCYNNSISHVFFVVFAFYFGYHCAFFYDISFHYYEFSAYYVGHSFFSIINNPLVFSHGHDIFHVLVKYAISLVSTSKEVFGGVFCAIHFALFLFFFKQLREAYSKKISTSSGLILITVCLVFQFWWYSNFRFCCAVFYFGGFYLKYIRTRNPINLLFAALCPLMHYTLVALDAALVLELLYKYVFKAKALRYIVLVFSLVIRSFRIDFVPFLVKHVPWVRENMSYAVVNSESRKIVLKEQEAFREGGNFVYNVRSYVLLLLGLFLIYFFKRCHAKTNGKYLPAFYMFLTIFTLANFGYADMHVYNRLMQASMLFLWAYVFMVSVENAPILRHRNLVLTLILVLPVLYFFITPFAQFRNALLYPELFFGNFFMDWTGNESDAGYALYRKFR